MRSGNVQLWLSYTQEDEMKTKNKVTAIFVSVVSMWVFAAVSVYAAYSPYPHCPSGDVTEVGSGYLTYPYFLPAYRWLALTCDTQLTPPYPCNGILPCWPTDGSSKIFLLHPAWDPDGKFAIALAALVFDKKVSYTVYPSRSAMPGWIMTISIHK